MIRLNSLVLSQIIICLISADFKGSCDAFKSKKLLEEDDYRRIYPSATSLPAMYGLPKIHKPTVPLRPILSATGSYNQECAKWLSQNLAFLREHPTNLKDSFTFVNNMKDKFLHNKVIGFSLM